MRAPRPSKLRYALSLVLLCALPAATLVASPAHSVGVIDGSAPHRAAASCWEVKQNLPSATDGPYWLITPQLQAPAQFHCDMTTDGGGWVLVGRGRDGWMWDGNGKGTPDQVSALVTGPGAFSPRQLPSSTIDGLLGGRRLDSLSDGVRLRRATNTAGTSWQEVRFTFKSRDRWSWAFGAGHPIANFSMGGSNGSNTTTRDFGTNSGYNRVRTMETSANGYIRGFTFGSGGSGSAAAGSFVYSTDGNYGTPFTQVFIRPRTTTSDMSYPAVPDSGTSAQTALPVAKNGALPASWGVTGTGAGGTGELATEVQAFAQVGNRMYVGGNFTTVQKGADATGADKVSQAYLAAFDATTGDWISSFRPTFNNQVKSLAALPGGKLAVGGEFTNVNGSGRAGLVVLDLTSGDLDPTWDSDLENRVSGGSVSVRGLDTSGTHLYAAGAFSHVVRGSSAVFARNGARLSLTTGRADGGWNPNFNGTATGVDVDDDGSRAYFSGYFTKSGSATADRGAAVGTGSTATLVSPAWQPTHSTTGSAKYQQAVKQIAGKVWLGGSQHNMFAYDTSNFALESAWVSKSGGDIQAIGGDGDVVYSGCHCGDWNYATTTYDGLSPGQTSVTWTQAEKISLVGAYRADTGAYVPEFAPQWKSRRGYGAWALTVASDGTLWAGGSMESAVRENGSNQWVGGFARFEQRPHTAPDKPTAPAVQLRDDVARVSWTRGSTPGATYEVIRNDRVVAMSTGLSVNVPDSAPGDKFFVRASDGEGNRSASTSAVRPSGGTSSTVLSAGSTWRYLFDNSVTLDGSWKQPSFQDGAWRSGPGPLGWGNGPIATNIDVAPGQTRAITSYHRTTFTVPDPGSYQGFRLTTRADDGLVVYVNGTEVARANLPSGTITRNTYATAAPSTATALANPVVAQIPTNLIQSGSNTIAVEVHSNYRSTPSSSFDAQIEAQQ